MKKKEDVFELIFSTDGVLVDVKPPPNRKLKFGPTSISQLSFDQLRGKNITLKNGNYSFEDLLFAGNIEMKLLIVNSPGNSICGGVCGGIAFSWC
ncbi:MAG: hypothetical protein GQ575_02085 [Deltaproteobacteria bacterium]|nr:hypothetical protein [Deltaproteobacteria bacterium]